MPDDRGVARVRHPRHNRRGEARLPGVVATIAAIALYLGLPQELLIGPRYLIPGLELLLLIPLLAINPTRLTRETRISRILSLSLVFLIAATNLAALGMLIDALLVADVANGRALLVGAFQVWLTNVIVFGLAFWNSTAAAR